MKKQVEDSFRKKCKFEVSLRYEIFYSLTALLDASSRIHPAWRKQSYNFLGRSFVEKLKESGLSWEIWNAFPALLPSHLSRPSFEEIKNGLEKLPIKSFQEKILLGIIHSKEAVHAILSKRSNCQEALAKIPKAKREWLHHVGLYPYDPTSPQVFAIEKLIADPKGFRKNALEILEIYWQKVFQQTWQRIYLQFQKSIEERERLFYSCSFAEFAKQSLLRIEVKEKEGSMCALRGGYQLLLRDIEACYFVPSAFNDRRFWSAFGDDNEKTTVYFPCFVPSINIDLQMAGENFEQKLIEPQLDPALIFKALGDSTRFAMVSILARSPKSSVELAKILSVSKPTISHHVHLLREAGLLQETYVNGSVELQLKRSAIERLSDLTITKLYENEVPLALMRTRGGMIS